MAGLFVVVVVVAFYWSCNSFWSETKTSIHRLPDSKYETLIPENLIKLEIHFSSQGVGFCHRQRPFLGRELNLLSALKGSIVLQAGLRRTIILFTSCNSQQFNWYRCQLGFKKSEISKWRCDIFIVGRGIKLGSCPEHFSNNNLSTLTHIWVSFCRAGILAISCHIFSKSRAFVWPNLMR